MGQYARQRLFLVGHAKLHLILLRISCGGGVAIRVVVVCVSLVMNPRRRLPSLVCVCSDDGYCDIVQLGRASFFFLLVIFLKCCLTTHGGRCWFIRRRRRGNGW